MPVMNTVIDGKTVLIALEKAERILLDQKKPLMLFAQVIADSTENRFRNGGDPPGSWKDITARTRKRRKGDKSAPPLTDTGAMRLAATATRYGVLNSLFQLMPDALQMGTNALGAEDLQNGSEQKNIPARPFMYITQADEANMTAAYQAYLIGQLGRIG